MTVKKKKDTKKYTKGEYIFVDHKKLKGDIVLGKLYQYDGIKVRLVYITNNKFKLLVEEI